MGGVRRRARALITDRDRDPQEWVRAIGGMGRFLAERFKGVGRGRIGKEEETREKKEEKALDVGGSG
jgi:hypothetical protein